jgi:O-antigen/teichoic acid export membrane protein
LLDSPPPSSSDARPPSSERAHTRGAWISLASQVIAAALAYLLQIMLARALGTDGFGVYAAVLAWVGPLAVIAAAGLPTAALRFLPAYEAERDHPRVAGFLRGAERVALLGSVALAAAGSAAAILFLREPVPLLVGLWTMPLQVELTLHTEIARAAGRHETAFLLPLLQPLAMLAGALAAKELLGGLTPALGLCLPALGALAVLPWQRSLARRRGPAAEPRYETRAWLRAGLGVLVIDAAYLLMSHADILLLGALKTSRAVALFSMASGIAAFSMFPMIAVGSTVVPAFSRLWALGRTDALERLAQRAVLRAFGAQVAIAALALYFARPLLAASGADFEEAQAPLAFILLGQLANTGTGYVGSLVTMTGHQGAALRGVWAAAITNVVMVAAGTHVWGATGAAAATALTSLLWNIWLYQLVRRMVGVRISIADAALAFLRDRRAAWPSPASGPVNAPGAALDLDQA